MTKGTKMSSTEKRPGRPAKGSAPRTLTPFGAAAVAALDARRDAMSPGPRNMADLARVLGVRPSTLHLQLTGRRPMPAETAASIRRALPEIDHE